MNDWKNHDKVMEKSLKFFGLKCEWVISGSFFFYHKT